MERIVILQICLLALIFVLGGIKNKKYPFNNFLLILQFITRLPLKINLSCEKENFKNGTLYFPVVGIIIGLIQYLVFIILKPIIPIEIVAIFTVLTGVLVTGGLHIDGLGDTCDGFFAFKGEERIIEIMKDSRVGTFGVLAVIFDMVLRISAISVIGQKGLEVSIIAVPCITRAFTILACYIGKPAKPNGTGNLYIANTNLKYLIGAISIAFLVGNLLLGTKPVSILMLGALIITIIFNRFSKVTIGGHTGDTLGANNELVEILLFVLCGSFLI